MLLNLLPPCKLKRCEKTLANSFCVYEPGNQISKINQLDHFAKNLKKLIKTNTFFRSDIFFLRHGDKIPIFLAALPGIMFGTRIRNLNKLFGISSLQLPTHFISTVAPAGNYNRFPWIIITIVQRLIILIAKMSNYVMNSNRVIQPIFGSWNLRKHSYCIHTQLSLYWNPTTYWRRMLLKLFTKTHFKIILIIINFVYKI